MLTRYDIRDRTTTFVTPSLTPLHFPNKIDLIAESPTPDRAARHRILYREHPEPTYSQGLLGNQLRPPHCDNATCLTTC
jgi:hypothetical protein